MVLAGAASALRRARCHQQSCSAGSLGTGLLAGVCVLGAATQRRGIVTPADAQSGTCGDAVEHGKDVDALWMAGRGCVKYVGTPVRLQLFPGSDWVSSAAAQAHYNMRNFDEAQQLFEDVYARDPHRLEVGVRRPAQIRLPSLRPRLGGTHGCCLPCRGVTSTATFSTSKSLPPASARLHTVWQPPTGSDPNRAA